MRAKDAVLNGQKCGTQKDNIKPYVFSSWALATDQFRNQLGCQQMVLLSVTQHRREGFLLIGMSVCVKEQARKKPNPLKQDICTSGSSTRTL